MESHGRADRLGIAWPPPKRQKVGGRSRAVCYLQAIQLDLEDGRIDLITQLENGACVWSDQAHGHDESVPPGSRCAGLHPHHTYCMAMGVFGYFVEASGTDVGLRRSAPTAWHGGSCKSARDYSTCWIAT